MRDLTEREVSLCFILMFVLLLLPYIVVSIQS